MNTLDRISALQFRVLGIDEDVKNDGRQHQRLDAIFIGMGLRPSSRQYSSCGVLKGPMTVGFRLRLQENIVALNGIYCRADVLRMQKNIVARKGIYCRADVARYHHWLGAEG